MKYYSEKTHKLYDTAEALQTDEENTENIKERVAELNVTIKDLDSKLKELRQERDELQAQDATNIFFNYIWR